MLRVAGEAPRPEEGEGDDASGIEVVERAESKPRQDKRAIDDDKMHKRIESMVMIPPASPLRVSAVGKLCSPLRRARAMPLPLGSRRLSVPRRLGPCGRCSYSVENRRIANFTEM